MGERSKVGLIDDPAWQEPPPAPVQRPRKSRAVAVGGAFVLAGLSAATWIVVERDQSGLSACTAVTRTMIERSVGAHVSPGIAGRPDGGVPGATMCQYGAISGTRPSCFPPPPTPGSRCRRQCSLRTDSTSTSTYLGHCPEPPPWLGRLQPTFRRYHAYRSIPSGCAPPEDTTKGAHSRSARLADAAHAERSRESGGASNARYECGAAGQGRIISTCRPVAARRTSMSSPSEVMISSPSTASLARAASITSDNPHAASNAPAERPRS